MIARDLGRTRTELLQTTSARELVWLKALYMVEDEEHEAREAERQQTATRRRR